MITGLLQWFRPALHKPRLPQAGVAQFNSQHILVYSIKVLTEVPFV